MSAYAHALPGMQEQAAREGMEAGSVPVCREHEDPP